MKMQTQIQLCKTEKAMQRLGVVYGTILSKLLTVIYILAFSWFLGTKEDAFYTRNTVKSHRSTWTLLPFGRAKMADLSMRRG
jgi:hypothetical protein